MFLLFLTSKRINIVRVFAQYHNLMNEYNGIYPTIDYKDTNLLFQVAKDGNTLKVQGIWKDQQFGMAIPGKLPKHENVDLLQELVNNCEELVIELSEYDKDIMQLHEQCRQGRYDGLELQDQLYKLAEKHDTTSRKVIEDLFAC
jgi:hypothetical protein